MRQPDTNILREITGALKCHKLGYGLYSILCPVCRTTDAFLCEDKGKFIAECTNHCSHDEICDRLTAIARDAIRRKCDASTSQDIWAALPVYEYRDENGNALHRIIRKDSSDYLLEQKNEHGEWENAYGCKLADFLYRLDDLLNSNSVFIAKDEADVEALRNAGVVATTYIDQGKGWPPAFNDLFKGKRVAVLSHLDSASNKRAAQIARGVFPYAVSLDLLQMEFPSVTEWLGNGHSHVELQAIIEGQTVSGIAVIPITRYADIRVLEQEQARSAGSSNLSSIPSLSSIPVQMIDFVVDGLIARSSVTLISGESGSGKSTLSAAMANAICTGTPFAGLATRQTPVLYLDRENTLPVVQERMSRLNISDSTMKYWGGWLPEQAPALNSATIIDFVKHCNPKPVIIADSLVSFHPGNENDSTETRRYMNQARDLANLGAAVVLIHHTGKAEAAKDYRGSSDIKASVDVAYLVKNSDSARLERLELTAFKARFSTLPKLSLRYDNGQFLRAMEGEYYESADEELSAILRDNPGVLASQFEEIAKQQCIARARARRFLDEGVASGRVKAEPHGARGKAHYLTDTHCPILPSVN